MSPHPLSDPLHENSLDPRKLWSRTNAAEALPGVPTPLNWTLYGGCLEKAMRWSWYRMGILTKSEMAPLDTVDDRVWGIFYGRVAVNCDTWRMMGDRTPGTSGDAVEMQFFNAVRPGVTSRKVRRRYLLIVTKAPCAARAAAQTLDRLRSDTDRWWRESIAVIPDADSEAARRLLADAGARFDKIMSNHVLASLVAQGTFDQLARLSDKAGHPGLQGTLTSGYGGMEETRLTGDLVALAHDRLARSEFLTRHGFHGPMENEVASRSWREDPVPLDVLLARYRVLSSDAHPRAVATRRRQVREQAVATLLDGLSPLDRIKARLVLKLAARFIPLREQGRATLMQAQDVVRFAARAIGSRLVSTGDVGHPDDAFYLTRAELESALPPNLAELVAFRKSKRAQYLELELPSSWEGTAEPTKIADPIGDRQDATPITGLGGSPGAAEGTVRIVRDPGQDLEQGEILVCETTDPGWTPLFFVAAAVVVDIGGLMSHGPIVAREFGIPCVINTGTGTKELRNGDLVRVDGGAGIVEILKRGNPE